MSIIAGNQARSRMGHAAMSMKLKDGEDNKWVDIQRNTFFNWVNEQLRPTGERIDDLQTDLCDGVRLCALISSLQHKDIRRVVKKPVNQHQFLENVTLALQAIANDNIKLVNIGSEDIVKGSLKLILGLIWHLILRYQIGHSRIPPKKLMLAWLKAVVPERNITNFTKNWNDGVALHALLEYCQPGLCPNWRQMNASNRLENCRNGMALAEKHFNIPLVLRPEDLSSEDLDELSGMTYLSYFMKLNSPGYYATLKGVQRLMKNQQVSNFTSDWYDGRTLCQLVVALGGHVSGWPNLTGSNTENLQLGIDAARQLGVDPILTAKEMADETGNEHLGIMAYAAYFSYTHAPVKTAAEKVSIDADLREVYVGKETHFRVQLEDDSVSPSSVKVEVAGPDSHPAVRLNWHGRTADGYFIATETGQHKITAYYDNQVINGCPKQFRAIADRSKVSYAQLDRCCVGVVTEIKVNASAAGQGDVRVEARAPSGHMHNIPVMSRQGTYHANFTPTEVGAWQMSIFYDGEHISGSPFMVNVFDPVQVQIFGLEGGAVGRALTFTADCTRSGEGDLRTEITHDGRAVPVRMSPDGPGNYNINFTPQGPGVYKVRLFFNDVEIRGSPYTLEIVDSSLVSATGDGLSLIAVNRMAAFTISTVGAGGGDIKVEVASPTGAKIPVHVINNYNDTYRAEYTVTESGEYTISVLYCGQPLPGSPWVCSAYDPSRIIVDAMPKTTLIGNTVSFHIDASRAGQGNLEIMVNGGRTECRVENHGDHKFTASFEPDDSTNYSVEINFHDQPVPGSPWTIQVMDLQTLAASGQGLELVPVKKPATFSVGGSGANYDKLQIEIIGPNGEQVNHYERAGEVGEKRIEYTPNSIGNHEINVKYANRHTSGSPFTAKAYDTAAIQVSPLSDGLVGKPLDFFIDVNLAGEGQLEIMVNDGNLPNKVTTQRAGVYKVSFIPTEPGTHSVEIRFNGEQLLDAPFKCNVIDAAQVNVKSFTKIVCINEVTGFIIQSDAGIKADMPATVDVFCKSMVVEGISRCRVTMNATIKDLFLLFLSIILFYLIH